jgi:hypothetical protein
VVHEKIERTLGRRLFRARALALELIKHGNKHTTSEEEEEEIKNKVT